MSTQEDLMSLVCGRVPKSPPVAASLMPLRRLLLKPTERRINQARSGYLFET